MYEAFASLYDRLIDVDYDAWISYYEELFRTFGASPHMVLDLACGTGEITCRMAERGYDMIGVDASFDMLNIAQQKALMRGQNILFLNQDMTSFELYGTVDAVVASLDSVNYLLSEEEVGQCFHWVNNYLNDGGLFVFDISSAYKLSEVLGDHTFITEEQDVFYTWENQYDRETGILNMELNLFQKEGAIYRRTVERQEERAYTVTEITDLLTAQGFIIKGVFREFTMDAPEEDTERIFFVAEARNQNKEGTA